MTILRKAEHQALAGFPLSGKVLDLGGDTRSDYRNMFSGDYAITTVNMLPEAKPDILADLEEPLPIEDASYDAVLLINVMEHVFEYRALLLECARVLRPGGTIVIIVPYLFPYHASPHDYHRYSAEALSRALLISGFKDDVVRPLGSGIISARVVLTERLLPGAVQSVLALILHPLAGMLDGLFSSLARLLRKKYSPSDYALGFLASAKKAV
ncbi:MAG TPA: class I SAM-dependent methyltransferase [Candidatus Paceibacterota bacterium]|nr:class I SAM-dependent methyltransferase [Candidatus Paceibacterota bacterium]